MYVLQAIGIPNWGFRYVLRSPRSRGRQVGQREPMDCHCLFYSGWILSLIALRKNTAVAVMMILVSLFFTAVAVLGIIMLKKVSEERTLGAKTLGRVGLGWREAQLCALGVGMGLGQ